MKYLKSFLNIWFKVRSWVAVVSILGLGALNVATLIDDQMHKAAYGFLSGLVNHLPAETATKVLARSPTSVHQGLVKRLDVQKLKVHAISHRVMPKITRLATRSLASLPAKIVPVLGVPVTIGFTVWELTELCYMMKDFDDLNRFFDGQDADVDKVCGLKLPDAIAARWPPAQAVPAP